MNKQLNTPLSDEVLTQPMRGLCTSTKVGNRNSPKQNTENSDAFLEIFSLTQQTQPMVDSFDSGSLFAPVEGMPCTKSSNSSVDRITTKNIKPKPISKLLRKSSRKAKRAACLPPLPPVTRPGVSTHNSPESAVHASLPPHNFTSLKRSSDSPFGDEKNRKQCRRESNCSVLSGQGLVTKTHEILCHVQPSENVIINTKSHCSLLHQEKIKGELEVVPSESSRPVSISCNLKKRSHSFGGSLSHTSSVLAGRRLLWKYRNKPHRLSTLECNISSKSPGWSRWRQMYHELRRRSSSLRITFHKSCSVVGKCESKVFSESDKGQKTHIKKGFSRRSSTSGHIAFSLPRWGRSVNRRSQRRTSEKSGTPLLGKKQEISDVTFNTALEKSNFLDKSQDGLSSASVSTKADYPKETCHFIMPLRRLISRDYFHSKSLHSRFRSSLRQNKVASPIIQLKSPHGYSAYKCDLDSPISNGQLNGSNVSMNSLDIYCQPLHCSACGETIILHTDISNANVISPGRQFGSELLLRQPSLLSCSVSSSYWQAEDPGDTIFTDAHLDALVEANRRYLPESDSVYSQKCENMSLHRNSSGSSLQTNSKDNTTGHREFKSSTSVSNLSEVPLQQCISAALLPDDSCNDAQTDNNEGRLEMPISNLSLRSEVIDNTESSTHRNDDSSRIPDQSSFSTQGRSSKIMPIVNHDHSRHECEELEAVVAALQRQLEAQADELSPESAAELLKSACTEPLDSTPDGVAPIVESVPERRHDEKSTSVDNDMKQVVVSIKKLQTNIPTVSQLSPRFSEVLETCASETVDIIPSSQTEDELENLISCKPGHSNQKELKNVTSSLNNSLCDFIPGSLSTSSQIIHDPVSLTQSSLSNITQCPETNLSSCSTPVDENQPLKNFSNCQKNIAVTGSNLSPSDAALLHKFCLQFNVSEHSRFIPQKTTHVVIKEEVGRPRVVKRTLKYFLGILNRAWIVNTDWVRECVASKTLVDESPYEIEGDTVCGDCHEGPRRGRLGVPAIPQSLDRLPLRNPANLLNEVSSSDRRPFSELWLCAYRNLGALQLGDFCQLALDGGAARVFERPAELVDAINKLTHSLECSGTDVRKPRAVILTDRDSSEFNLQECQELYRVYGVPVISIEWMLNCISLYRRLPINQAYRICPTPQPVSMCVPKA
ncbi:Breast cancer type 1 susceptibility protein [Schistosoma japonicum]|uniref:Breast cancer type 1 susceptibility protein n=1 Tax=Schistosoma japonicum TaxID=6182 RepID=A0A4Z2CPE5_SCHJA|nr:Breast cancer type 1 susceptibility protein [Schistosoma japonicum]